jgi:hypothetical protein
MIFLAEISYAIPISECGTFTQTKNETRIVIAENVDDGMDKVKKHLTERGVKFLRADFVEAIQ